MRTFMIAMVLVALMPGGAAIAQKPAAPATAPATRPVRQAADGTLVLKAIDARVEGKSARIEKKGDRPHNIGYWTNVQDRAIWRARLDQPGRYTVEVEYSLDERARGAQYVIELGERSILVKPEVTGTWLDFRSTVVGEVELPAGELKVIVRGEKKPGQAVLDLRGITLRRADAAGGAGG